MIAAAHTLGIPHPPGTPLFVVAARTWSVLLGALPPALATNLLSAVSTAAACGALAACCSRWLRSGWAGAAAGLGAGLMATVWRNATETEVYALALCLAALTLLAADAAGRHGGARRLVLVAYLLALAVPLHLFALVAAPAAVLLAASDADGRLRRRDALLLGGAAVVAAGVGTMRPWVVAVGLAAMLGAGLTGRTRALPLGAIGAIVLGASAVLVLLLRARHDPVLDQGNPATWRALADVLARRQYAVPGLWPRQAPPWLQLGNLIEYADWQVALSLGPDPAPTWGRTLATVAWALLGLVGCRAHRRQDRRSWRALLVLLLGASVGVVAYLNLRASPSYGDGFLPPGAPREARERDYFFTFAFWSWGAWAGIGAVTLATRLARGRAWVGVLVALLPAALNWRAVDRARGPDARLARDAARTLLLPLPPRTVLLTGGDNDSYPLWYLQQVEDTRRDVTVIVTPLLPAEWYRAELRRRGTLRGEAATRWLGTPATIAGIATTAAAAGRPVVTTGWVADTLRARAGAWDTVGPWYVLQASSRAAGTAGGPPVAIGRLPSAAFAARLAAPQLGGGRVPDSSDPASRVVRRLLACAGTEASETPGAGSLASICNRR
ncbi:MAG TPA: DUF2723 domain-containing protein [Gemmatimonadaceae bacterium]|nr:DUF2723 domain-containing protein [Gemmatimonadaceae bacterium]